MSHLIKIALAASLAVLSFGFAQAENVNSGDAATEDAPRQCVLARAIDDYSVIDRRHIVFIHRREEAFFLGRVNGGCWDLPHAYRIALETPMMSLCHGGTATIEVMDFHSGTDRCFVTDIEAVSSVEAARALLEERSQSAELD